MTAAEAWDAGDYELADKLPRKQISKDAIRNEILIKQRWAHETVKPWCRREIRS